MQKYYVYKVTRGPDEEKAGTTRALVYVTDPMAFAISQFNPMTMEFCGVVVEADSLEHAQRVYNKPQPNDVVLWTDEPRATRARREMLEKEPIGTLKDIIDDTEKAINQLAINKLQLAINSSLDLLNKQISEMAFRIRKQTDMHSEIEVDKIYDRLKERAIDTLYRISKYDRPGNDL